MSNRKQKIFSVFFDYFYNDWGMKVVREKPKKHVMGKLLENKIALVTSATRGIGLACAERLADCGAKVCLAVRRQDAGGQVADKIIERGGYADTVYFDASVASTFTSMIDQTVARHGRIDILVNNFGHTDVAKDKDVVGGDTDDFFDIVDLNLRSVYEPSKAAIGYMMKTGGGSIVNISSVGGTFPDLSRTAYGVSKAAINFLTLEIAVQYARYGIRCNAVSPGFTATDAAMRNMSPEFLKAFLANVPLSRAGRPEDIAAAVAFLASDDASYITGEILPVAGGFGVPTPLYNMYAAMNSER